MNKLIEIYQDYLLYVFHQDQLQGISEKNLVIIKDDCKIIDVENCLIMHYSDEFEKYLKFQIPTKNRKLKQLISLNECYQLLHKIEYGVLSFQKDEYPYSIGINHIVYKDRIFFHCAMKGYKLNGVGEKASFIVIDDLGINKKVGTHNHNSVIVYGQLQSIEDFDLKKNVLLELIQNLAPAHPINDRMVTGTHILELKIDYVTGKSHIR